jgi:hypothetical protein
LFIACLSVVSAGLYAQGVSDPVYAYVDRWEARGYLEPLYTLRPYSPEVLHAILARVVEVGSQADAASASGFLEAYAGSSFDAGLVQRSDARFGGDVPDGFAFHGETGGRLSLLSGVLPGIWAQGIFDVVMIDGTTAVKPETERNFIDIQQDGSMSFFPPGISGDAMSLLYGLSSNVWLGSESLWGSAGYARSSAGPFFNNGVVVGPQAHAAPNWTLNLSTGSFRFSTALFQLTQHAGASEKYLVHHTYSYAPVSRIDLGFFESTVWGGSFKPQYLIPFSFYYYLQSLGTNYGDNSLVGLYGTWKPVDGLLAKATVFFDDVGFSDLVEFDLDTKIIGAAQAGLSWAPESGIPGLVSLDYTAIFPYMYAHRWTVAEDDYTHYGDSFGAALQPNSDRWELRASLIPVGAVSFELVSRLIRHGNASDGITDGDGTWFDDGWDGGAPTYQEPYETGTSPEYFRFLSQDVIETTFQVGASVSWKKSFGKTALSLSGRYTMEAVWNEDLAAGANGLYHYLGLDASWNL